MLVKQSECQSVYPPTEFSVSQALDAGVPLHLEHSRNCFIFDYLQLLWRAFLLVEFVALYQEVLRALQRPEMFGAIGRVNFERH